MLPQRLLLASIIIAACALFIGIPAATTLCQEQGQTASSTLVQIALAPAEYQLDSGALPSGVAGPFNRGSKIRFGLVVTNISAVPLRMVVGAPFTQNRPVLFQDGLVVSYRQETKELLDALQNPRTIRLPRRVTMVINTVLEPNQSAIPEYIDLARWYEPLKPGHYALNLEHRLGIGDEPWITCSPITFEVSP